MKSYDVVGYAYDADVHCVPCSQKAYSQDDLDLLSTRHMAEFGGTLDSDPTPIFPNEAIENNEHCGDCGVLLVEE